MDISSLYNVSSDAIRTAAAQSSTASLQADGSFDGFLNSAVNQLDATNGYLNDQEEEEIKLSLGLTDNTHDLSIAQAKAATSLQYTVALRDRFIDAYKEIMQIQI